MLEIQNIELKVVSVSTVVLESTVSDRMALLPLNVMI